jgi:dienelactone hydrolase
MYIDFEYLSKRWEKALQEKLFAYSKRQESFWQRDYKNVDQYLRSVQTNRRLWRRLLLGLTRQEAFVFETKAISKGCLSLNGSTLSGRKAQALLMLPDQPPPYPLVMCLHGMEGTPEMVLGFDHTLDGSYHGFGAKLVEAGYAVLSPALLNTFEKRNRLSRLALILGTTLWGLETEMLSQCLTYVLQSFSIDSSKLCMWGISMGGAYTLYSMPLDLRIRVGIVSAWFNHRLKKMAVEDSRYTCFLPTAEEHAFIPALLSHFRDSDLISLICPRQVQIQAGKKDDIHWIPFVQKEYRDAERIYEKLDYKERIELRIHDGGHEVAIEDGLHFLSTVFAV